MFNYPMTTQPYSLSDIAAASGSGYRNNDGDMWVELVHGGLLFFSCFALMVGAIMVGIMVAEALASKAPPLGKN